MIELLGSAAISGGVLPLVMSLIKDIGGTWPSQVKKLLAFALAGAASAIAIGSAPEYGWDQLGNFQLVAGVWGYTYSLMQVTYAWLWKDTRIETALQGTLAGSGHPEVFELDEA